LIADYGTLFDRVKFKLGGELSSSLTLRALLFAEAFDKRRCLGLREERCLLMDFWGGEEASYCSEVKAEARGFL
jgi:hypothetical protein